MSRAELLLLLVLICMQSYEEKMIFNDKFCKYVLTYC